MSLVCNQEKYFVTWIYKICSYILLPIVDLASFIVCAKLNYINVFWLNEWRDIVINI